MFVYLNHLHDGFFTSERELTYDEMYCSCCNDADTYIGQANTKVELARLLIKEGVENDDIRQLIEEIFGNKTAVYE